MDKLINKFHTRVNRVGFLYRKFLLLTPLISILSTVFIIDNSLANGLVSGKYFWFYGSMGLVVISTLFQSLNQPLNPLKGTFNVRFSITDLFVFFFTGSVFLSAWLSGDFSTNATKVTLLTLLLVLYVCIRTVNSICYIVDGKFRILICFFIIITGLVEAVWGLMQLYGFKTSQHGLFRLTGSFFNPGPYAGYLAVVFPLALSELRTKSEELRVKGKKFLTLSSYLISLLTCIAIILVLPAAMSRAAWLAAIAGSVVVLAARYWNKLRVKSEELRFKGKEFLTLSSYLLVLLVLSSFVGMYYLKKNSADGRLLTWKISLHAVAKNPFGVGLGHFSSAYGDAQAAYFASGKASETEEYVAGNPEYGFNEFLQIAVESGIASLGLFIAMIFFAIKGLIKGKQWEILGSLVALLIFACFSYPFSVLPFPIILIFLLALSNANGTRITRIERINADNNFESALIRTTSVISVLLVTSFCLYKQYPVYGAYKQWNKSRMYYQMGIYKEVAANYEPLYPYLSDQIQFLFEYGRSLSQDAQGMADQVRHDRLVKSNEILQQATRISCDPMLYNIVGRNYQAMEEYNLAEQSLLKSTQIVPNRLYPWYLLMKLYVETGDEVKANETAGIVLTKEPKVQSTAVKEMREEAKRVKN